VSKQTGPYYADLAMPLNGLQWPPCNVPV